MKLLGYLLMTVFLCLGTISATTSYVPSKDGAVESLTLNAEAGAARLDQAALDAAKSRPASAFDLIGVMRDRKIGRPIIEYRLLGDRGEAIAAEPGVGVIALAPGADGSTGWLVLDGLSRRQLTQIEEMAGAAPEDATPITVEDGRASTPLAVPDAAIRSGDWPTVLSFLSVVSLPDGALQPPDDAPEDTTARLDASGVVVTGAAGAPDAVPLAKGNDRLAGEVLAAVRGSSDGRVRVKSFSFARWDLWWLFALSVLGLIVGGLLVRTQTKREIAAKAAADDKSPESPTAAIAHITGGLRGLRAELDGIHDVESRLDRIVRTLGEMQQTHIAAVVGGRATLVGKLGLGGFAEFMDRFSVAERQINRAWSAAADGAHEEALASLDRAILITPEAEAILRA